MIIKPHTVRGRGDLGEGKGPGHHLSYTVRSSLTGGVTGGHISSKWCQQEEEDVEKYGEDGGLRYYSSWCTNVTPSTKEGNSFNTVEHFCQNM